MITEEERIHIKTTLALMNCIIKSGECHSKQSNEMLTKSFAILLREAEPAQIAQKNEFVIPAVSVSVCPHCQSDSSKIVESEKRKCFGCGRLFYGHTER